MPSPDQRAAPLRSGLPRHGRCVPTAARGPAPAHAGRPASCRDPPAFSHAPAFSPPALPAPNSASAPSRAAEIRGAGGKLVARLQSHLSGTPTTVSECPPRVQAPRPRSPGYATYLLRRPPRAGPASRAVLSSRARAAPERRARSRSCGQPRAGRQAPRASERVSERAGGRLKPRLLLPSQPPPPASLGPSLLFPPSSPLPARGSLPPPFPPSPSSVLSDPALPRSLARLLFPILQSLSSFPLGSLFSDSGFSSIPSLHPTTPPGLFALLLGPHPSLFPLSIPSLCLFAFSSFPTSTVVCPPFLPPGGSEPPAGCLRMGDLPRWVLRWAGGAPQACW